MTNATSRSVSAWFARLAERRGLSIVLSGLISLTLASTVSVSLDFPVPQAHDEFSYLLAADTFASGRLTNPTHPMWPSLETFHVIHQPSYMSKYPPAQGLALAVGKLLGHPIIGAWLSTAAACMALTWALYGWFPPRWALLGGLLAPFHPTILLWSQIYWGGSMAMLGGALVAGAARRLGRRPRCTDGAILALGVAILANSRPWEGLVVTVLCLGMLAFLARGETRSRLLPAAGVPLLVGGIIVGALMAWYNHTITGDALTMPYIAHERQYSVTPIFVFQKLRSVPQFRHAELFRYHVHWSIPLYDYQRTFRGFLSEGLQNFPVLFRGAYRLFLPTISGGVTPANLGLLPRALTWSLLLPLLFLPHAIRRDRWIRAAALAGLLFALALLPLLWVLTHYAAPGAVFAYILLVAGLREMRLRLRERGLGTALLGGVVAAWLLSAFVTVKILAANEADPSNRGRLRAALQERLAETGEKHLIMVHYRPEHFLHFEWVFNDADIDASPVVWARTMDAESNRRLAEYFAGRRIWILDADSDPPLLVPHAGSGQPPGQ